jgi:hypothetical protein
VGDGSKQRVEPFPVFACKALAGIGELPDTIADRSLPIRLQRRGPGERVDRFRAREVEPQAEELRERLAVFAEKSVDALRDARPDLPPELDDRAQDVAEPLLAIADLAGGAIAGGEWPQRARAALVELRTGAAVEDESIGVRLLADVRRVFGPDRDRLSTAELLAGLNALEEAPWGEWFGKPLTNRGLAKLLKPYAVRTRTVRFADDDRARGFLREQFESAWTRYLPPSIRDSVTTRSTGGKTGDSEA